MERGNLQASWPFQLDAIYERSIKKFADWIVFPAEMTVVQDCARESCVIFWNPD
jgi:hypothetical protein